MDIKKKKIAYLASEYPAISHTFIYREIQNLRKLGFEILTLSIRKPEHLAKMTDLEKNEFVNTNYIKTKNIVAIILMHLYLFITHIFKYLSMFKNSMKFSHPGIISKFKFIAYFIEAGMLLYYMVKNKISHVHVHFANPAATVAMIASTYGTIEFSLSIHGPDIFYNVDTNLLAQKIKKAKFVRCISYYCQSQLMRIVPCSFWPKLFIVHCGVDIKTFDTRKLPNNEVFQLLCVGRLVPAKGQHILLKACKNLSKDKIKFKLTFVGDGLDRKSLELLAYKLDISDKIIFTGAIGQDEIHKYYDNADIFVLPSFAEGVPVVLMEAMAKEIACISTHITGIPELIDDKINGLLTTPSDVNQLTENIKLMIKDKELRKKLGKNGRKKIVKEFDLNKNCKKLAKIFDFYLTTF